MRHVDATLTIEDVDKIRSNAKTKCPTGLRGVWTDLAKQADSGLKEKLVPINENTAPHR